MKRTPKVTGSPGGIGECFTQISRLLNCVPRGQFETAPEGLKGWQIHRFSMSLVRNFLTFKKMAHKFPIPWLVLELIALKENF